MSRIPRGCTFAILTKALRANFKGNSFSACEASPSGPLSVACALLHRGVVGVLEGGGGRKVSGVGRGGKGISYWECKTDRIRLKSKDLIPKREKLLAKRPFYKQKRALFETPFKLDRVSFSTRDHDMISGELLLLLRETLGLRDTTQLVAQRLSFLRLVVRTHSMSQQEVWNVGEGIYSWAPEMGA